MDICICGGELVTSAGRKKADIRCRGGRIVEVADCVKPPPGARVVEASGKLVLPGFIDAHTHAYLPLIGTSARTDYAQCTRAALMGGTTTLMDFAGSGLEKDLNDGWSRWEKAAAGNAACDYLWHMTVTRFDAETEAQLLEYVRGGLKSIKIYLAYKPALAMSDTDLLKTLEFAARHNLVVLAHCENPDWIPERQAELVAAGKTGPEWHNASRPPEIEAEGVNRFLSVAALTGARAYIVHLTCHAALEQARLLRPKLKELNIETMIHYLLLDESYTHRPDFEGAKWILSPPLRDKQEQAILWDAIAAGEIQTLSTDHCPFNFNGQKTLGRDAFPKIPNGIGGVEERMMLAYTYGVAVGKITLEKLVEIAAENPAKIFGLWPRKGSLDVGADADVVVWNPKTERTISQTTQVIQTDYNPYEGVAVKGVPETVILRGTVMVENGVFVGPVDMGRNLLGE